MRAQVILTPAESKKLIAKAVARMPVMKRALEEGIVVMHPSSSTLFIAEEITGKRLRNQMWVIGVILPQGNCVELKAYTPPAQRPRTGGVPGDFSRSWVIEKGKLSTGTPLSALFERMGPKDVYIKGVNALDTEGTVGVLIGSLEGGTIARVIAASRQKGFSILFPVGLEKLIPIRIEDAAKEALKKQNDYSMGTSCALMPCKGKGIVVTELKAIEILSGATAIPIAAGGLGGAEGAVTLVIKGEEEQVTKAIEYIEQSKGARLPKIRTPDCDNCSFANCEFPVKGKPWVRE